MALNHVQNLIFIDSVVSITPLSFDPAVSMTPLSFDSAVPLTSLSHDSAVSSAIETRISLQNPHHFQRYFSV
jgi:hypothetical protein